MLQICLHCQKRMGMLPLKKRVNCDKCSFATKQRMFGVFAIDEILRYRWDPSLSMRSLPIWKEIGKLESETLNDFWIKTDKTDNRLAKPMIQDSAPHWFGRCVNIFRMKCSQIVDLMHQSDSVLVLWKKIFFREIQYPRRIKLRKSLWNFKKMGAAKEGGGGKPHFIPQVNNGWYK